MYTPIYIDTIIKIIEETLNDNQKMYKLSLNKQLFVNSHAVVQGPQSNFRAFQHVSHTDKLLQTDFFFFISLNLR
jgi:hypothetical protein